MARKTMIPCPEEDVEQMCLFRWALAAVIWAAVVIGRRIIQIVR